MLVASVSDVKIIRVDQAHEVAAYSASFAETYRAIWAEPPYQLDFDISEAQAVLHRHLSVPEQISLLAVSNQNRVVGFSIAVPLSARPQIARHLRGLLPVEHTFYLAGLGVLPRFRSKGVGHALHELRIKLLTRPRYTHVVLRTVEPLGWVYDMYIRHGFEDMGAIMEVEAKRTDGSTVTEQRYLLSRALDPLPQDQEDRKR